MRNWHPSTRLGGTALAASALGGCSLQADVYASLALLLGVLAAAAAGWLFGHLQARRALRAARQEARLLGQLAGGELWRSGSKSGATTQLDDGTPFGQRYDAGLRRDELAAALARAEPLGPCAVRTPAGARTLHALPWFDDGGAFAGHLGVARAAAGDGLAEQALATLARSWPDVLAVLRREAACAAGTPAWQLLHASPAAQRQLGEGQALESSALQQWLPAALRAALDQPGQAEADGWLLAHQQLAEASLLIVWRLGASVGEETAALSYTVSHDLRAPIRVVEGFTRIVKEDYGPALDRVANDHLDRVLGASARMNQMIDAVLTLARLSTQPIARQPVNLSQLAGYVVDDLRRSAPLREAKVEIEPGLQASGDPTLLRLVLDNLLGNAWKYSAKRAQAHIVFGRETVDGRPVFVVRDNGAGFDMRSAERLFGLFQRLHASAEFAGTGVGLASVRRIVQRHGGEIWADGEPGRGAAFFFTLPA
jgi:signal transduction histidine kinase